MSAPMGTVRDAVISPCGTYRYKLSRVWDSGPLVHWIMLNPSTADAEVDDPTIRRCIGFAHSWGFAGIVVRNLFALRATNPRALMRHLDPLGPGNDQHLLATGAEPDALNVAAWGVHGQLGPAPRPRRDEAVMRLLALGGVQLHHLGLTAKGSPRHPLYLPRTAQPRLLSKAGAAQ